MTINRLPLFRLPFLALCEILSFYGPREIIPLSLCSKRSFRVAKKCWKKKEKITAELCAKKISTVTLHFHKAAFSYRFVILGTHGLQDQQSVGDAVFPGSYRTTETITFWKDKIFGIGHIVNYIKELFDVPITKIELDSEEHPNEFIDTMDCIMSRQESVRDCTLRGEGPIDKCLTHLLDRCKITGELRVYGDLTDQFKNNWNIHLDSIYISNALCLTFQNLTNIDCQSLDVYSSSLTSKDLNQFLKHWQNGGSPRIRFASIMIKNSMNHDIVKSGIKGVPQPDTVHKSFLFMRSSTLTRIGGLDIQRNDGTTGTVYMFENKLDLGVDPIAVYNY
ncbi:unnamed protein product [Caenorhabditis brenneri]